MAAKGGNINEQNSLAFSYEQDEGTERNIENAIYWYKKAMENGCQKAKERLDILIDNKLIPIEHNLLKQNCCWNI